MSVTSSTARRIRKGSALPATCSPGEIFGKTSGGSEGMYFCVVANTWTGPFDTSADSGDVVGPASSTDNAVARYDLTTGKLIQNSVVTVDDSGSVNIPAGQTYKINNVALPQQAAVDAKANDADVVHDTGDETIAGVKTFSSDPIIPDEAYGVGWNGSLEPPTKNAVYDKIETIGGASYLKYVATLTQTGANAPVATVLENTSGLTITWARTSAGVYTATANSAGFTANKTFILQGAPTRIDVQINSVMAVRTSTTVITVETKWTDASGGSQTAIDDVLLETAFEIRIYP